jgi:integrase/recombinase XerC
MLNDRVLTDVHDILEKCIIEVLYQTGIRKAELCGLMFEYVNLSGNELKVIGKGNKERFYSHLPGSLRSA